MATLAGTAALGLFRELRTQPVRNRPRTSRRGQGQAQTRNCVPGISQTSLASSLTTCDRCRNARRSPRRAHTAPSCAWPPPAAAPPTDGTRRAARQSPGSVQETDTRARSSNGGYPAGAPAPDLSTASNGPSETGDDERHASTTVHLPPHPPLPDHAEKPQPPASPHQPMAGGDPVVASHGSATQWRMNS